MKNEWGNISWNSETLTQVDLLQNVPNCSASADSRHTEKPRLHVEASTLQPVNSLTRDPTSSSVHGPQIQFTCLTYTTPPSLKPSPTHIPRPP